MTLDQFISKWIGKKADFDGAYGGQCVDLYRFYVKEVLGFPQSPPVRGASDIWNTVDTKYFTKVSNTPSGIPNRGDIMIWNNNAGDGFGHVAIFLEGDVNSFTSLDQNWPTLSKVTKTKHNYNNVIGWLQPKEKQMVDIVEVTSEKFEELVTKSSRWEEVLKEGYTSVAQIKEEIKQLKQSASNAQASERVERERAEMARKELNSLISTTAKALNTQQEIGQIEAALVRVDKQLDQLEDLERQYAALQVSSGEKEEELRAEIRRLEELIKNSPNLAGSTMEQILAELIRRFKNILKGRQV